ncbi:uncharacterized protein LOC143921457 isoform X3 [Arctopsyche grandis]|uniref:uncharacterized protein LOC143921457 isoform X3 n=1 Tax=Arctopsyche grandis TaxID=121162 RepID=UPI00406D800C
MDVMEFPMQCRLCLCSAPAESFISIHENPRPHLAKRIWTCCQLQVKKGDRLPDMICRSCNNNLELLISFRKVCLRSDEISKLKLNKQVNIKQEEVLLEDLLWENEFDVHSPPNVYTTPVNDHINELELGRSAQTVSKPSIHSIEKANSTICGGKKTLCNRNSNEKLKTHKKTHTEDKLNKCEICLKSFVQKASLTRHLKTHTGLKPFTCDFCLKTFFLKACLTRHISTHTGLKPYKCDTCSKSFVQKACLTRHIKIHTALKPYNCDICLKGFVQKRSLIGHIETHTGLKAYKCDICLKSFSRKGYLVDHEKRHTGEKPHKCDICLKLFFDKRYLTMHMRSHTGDKPYQCEICLKSFARNSRLELHKKTHTRLHEIRHTKKQSYK